MNYLYIVNITRAAKITKNDTFFIRSEKNLSVFDLILLIIIFKSETFENFNYTHWVNFWWRYWEEEVFLDVG